MSLHWNLEDLHLHHRSVFLRGWLLQEGVHIHDLQLLLLDQNGRERSSIPLLAHQPRPDVEARFGRIEGSLHSGFVGLGAWHCRPQRRDRLQLRVTFEGFSQAMLHLDCGSAEANAGPLHQWRTRLQQWWAMGRKAITMLRHGDLQGVQNKLLQQAHQFGTKQLPDPEDWYRWLGCIPSGRAWHLIVDHQLGGGANIDREERVGRWLATGCVTITLTFALSRLAYELRLRWDDEDHRFLSTDDVRLASALSPMPLDTIVFNNAASFDSPIRVATLLQAITQNTKARLIVLLHDYYLICPTIYLLNNQGFFCDIPQPEVCQACLAAGKHLFATFYKGDITRWRNTWASLLGSADEIVAFSESSARLFNRVYGAASGCKPITIRPHQLSLYLGEPIEIKQPSSMVIGIIGQIGVQKGCKIVSALADEIRHVKGDERIKVIGNLECSADPEIVQQTGRYRREDLRTLLIASEANLILLPSIWPETFSFVCEELMHLQLPIACFDLGAPAERIRQYPKGLLLQSQSAAMILADLRHFFQQLYPQTIGQSDVF